MANSPQSQYSVAIVMTFYSIMHFNKQKIPFIKKTLVVISIQTQRYVNVKLTNFRRHDKYFKAKNKDNDFYQKSYLSFQHIELQTVAMMIYNLLEQLFKDYNSSKN